MARTTSSKVQYICLKCVKELKGTFPDDHVCTMHTAICDWCSKEAGLCHVSDYNWPKDSMFKPWEKAREF